MSSIQCIPKSKEIIVAVMIDGIDIKIFEVESFEYDNSKSYNVSAIEKYGTGGYVVAFQEGYYRDSLEFGGTKLECMNHLMLLVLNREELYSVYGKEELLKLIEEERSNGKI